MNNTASMSRNELVAYLEKPAAEFTKADIIRYIKENEIEMVNFMYPAGDGRLKTLNFVKINIVPHRLIFRSPRIQTPPGSPNSL